MTENEAIEWLKAINATQKESIHTSSLLNRKEALHIAIQALEEIQQYRTTGMTAEQIKEMQMDYCAKSVVLEEYRAVGTLEECREAVERMKPKKPYDVEEREETDFYYLAFMCPSCNEAVIGQPYRPNYCKHCGQAIDWEE